MTSRCHVTIIGMQDIGGANLPWTINYQFNATAVITSSQCASMANAIMTALNSNTPVKAILTTTNGITAVRVAIHGVDTGPETAAGVSTHATVLGSATSAHPPQVCVVATLRSSTPGRSFRGRLYWPATGLSMSAGGEISGTVQTAVNAGVQGIADSIIIAGAGVSTSLSWYIWSPTKGIGSPIITVSVGTRCDTQRRRNSGIDTYTSFPVT